VQSSDDSETERAKEEERKKAEEEKNQKESGTSTKGTNTPSGRPKHTDALKKAAGSRKRLGSPNASDASGTDTSRKKAKNMHSATSQPPSRPISPSVMQVCVKCFQVAHIVHIN
jgi:transcription initiation factor TFIIF subunit alpha